MRPYLLLTPGPLTTSESVKTAMMTKRDYAVSATQNRTSNAKIPVASSAV